MKPPVDILIPTWNNPEFLNPCVDSIMRTGVLSGLARLILINNGKQPLKERFRQIPQILVLEPGENLGWERGLEYGLKHSDSKFVCFQNDDTHIPKANARFYSNLLYPFANGDVGAVGPATTVASGWHSVYRPEPLMLTTEVSYLIFFTVMLKREDLEAAGGIDTACPGGDDIDLSIRLRKRGKRLVINPDAFIIHHGFKTGTRVRGDHTTPGGWNSKEMSDKTNKWLIQKHGFKTFMETIRGLAYAAPQPSVDREGEIAAEFVTGEKIYELGCGFRKTVPQAVGVDRVTKGESCPHLSGDGCVADIEADVTLPLPVDDLSADTVIARHILEHCVDTVGTLRNWARVLKIGGRMVIAVPNQEICSSIPMNPEHVHAFTPKSLKNLMELCGFKLTESRDPKNAVSFVSCFEKVAHLDDVSHETVGELINA